MSVETTSSKKEIKIIHSFNSSTIRSRAIIIGAIIIPFNNMWVIICERALRGPFPTIISIFANVIFILALLAAINTMLRRLLPRIAFSRAEMLVIYTMVAIGASLAGQDMMPSLVGMMVYPFKFATVDNNWANTFLPHLPQWLSVNDPVVLKNISDGHSSLYVARNLIPWILPVCFWVGFISVLLFVMMCINTLVRKQWTDRERLTFPIVQLPLSMTEPRGELWRNKLFWGGFAIAFGIDLINGLALYFPNLPIINVGFAEHNLGINITTKPWNAIGWTPYTFYPFVIGIGFLLPADLSFSCWFFYIFWKLQAVLTSAMAWDAVPDFPYVRHQAFGGYVAILVMLTWTSRNYLKQVWLRIQGEKSEVDDSGEPMSYRAAVVGALVGFIILAAFMVRIGMSPLVAVLCFVMYFILATAISRMRAELGPPVHDLHFSGPDYMVPNSVGINHLSKGDLVGLSYFYWFNRAYRGHPMPIQIEGMKMASSTKASQRKFMVAMTIAATVGAFGAFWAHLHLGYDLGLSSAKFSGGYGFSQEAIRNLNNMWSEPANLMKPNHSMNLAMLFGFIFFTFLGYARTKIFNWPFHPIGYAISGSWSMNLVWAPILIAWIFKTLTLHYGGLKLYKTLVPFALGLILGEMIMGSIWSLIGAISMLKGTPVPFYSFWGA